MRKVDDFAVSCANCHRMIHRTDDPSNLSLFCETAPQTKLELAKPCAFLGIGFAERRITECGPDAEFLVRNRIVVQKLLLASDRVIDERVITQKNWT